MKICFIHRRHFGFLPDIFEYAKFLIEQGHEVTFIGTPGDHLKLPNIQIHEVGFKSLRHFVSEVNKKISEYDFSIIHVFHFRGAGYFGLNRASKAKYILDIRTLHVSNRKGEVSRISFIKDKITWFESLFFNHVFALTTRIKQRMRPNWAGITVTPLGATRINRSEHNKHDFRQKTGIALNTTVYIYAGTLVANRKPDIYLTAFEKAYKNNSNCVLIIIGDDVDRPEILESLKQRARDLRIDSAVVFTGRIPYDQVKEYLMGSDIGLCYIPPIGSIVYQPATKILEYFAAGLKVVCNKTAANIEMCNELSSCFLTEHSDLALADGMIAASNSKESAEVDVEKVYWDSIVSEIVYPVYKKIVL